MKSLDKKKEYINKKDIIKYKIPVDKNFLKMFKDDDIFEINKPESLDKKKILSKCCNAPIEKLNDWGAEYMGCSKCFSAQSLDKNKTKELEWEKEWNKLTVKSYNLKTEKYEDEPIIFVNDKSWKKVKNFIQSLLTQQRTELLEEIRELIDSCYWIVGTNYVVNGKQEKMISKSEIIEKFTNLLNKKDV